MAVGLYLIFAAALATSLQGAVFRIYSDNEKQEGKVGFRPITGGKGDNKRERLFCWDNKYL